MNDAINNHALLSWANKSMGFCLISFIFATVGAYGFEAQLSLITVTLLHVSQLVLAGVFKLSYVARLVAQNQLGLALN
jgi:hypothetical protein